MATGITDREQTGSHGLSAGAVRREVLPLPTGKVELQYAGKAPTSDILTPVATSYSSLSRTGEEHVASTIEANALVLADNYYGLHSLLQAGKKATLIYLDPPYGTGFDFQSRQLEHSYTDRLSDASYLEFMRRRLILLRELLADDGSIYVHIGHQMLSHLKVLMDEIFGASNFRNLIVRRKCSSKNSTRKQYANLNDYLLFYTRSNRYKWNQPGTAPEADWLAKEYTYKDAKGVYKLVPVHAPGIRHGETGQQWRGKFPPTGKHWQYAPSKLDELDRNGEIHWSKTGNPRRKVYLDAAKLLPLTDYWPQYRDAHHQSIRITGYPTEKNLDMLRVIVGASTDPGDLVVDPFCGSGTTLNAANDLDRRWIGIDQSFGAIKSTLKRLRHGLERMGDYVNENKGGALRTSDLFERKSVFQFLVDTEVFEHHRTEVLDLAAL